MSDGEARVAGTGAEGKNAARLRFFDFEELTTTF